MDYNPYTQSPRFVELLNSQQDSVFRLVEESQGTEASSQFRLVEESQATPAERRVRRKWIPTDDIVLISSWLNTSKDPVVGNEQWSGAFWKRIATYFAASPKIAGLEQREASHCKQRWHKINDLVSKFCGCYEAATREKSSGQNENDILKLAHEIFYNNHKKNSTSNMRGRSFGMIRNGVTFLPLKLMASSKGESVRTVHNHQAHTPQVKLIKVPFTPWC